MTPAKEPIILAKISSISKYRSVINPNCNNSMTIPKEIPKTIANNSGKKRSTSNVYCLRIPIDARSTNPPYIPM